MDTKEEGGGWNELGDWAWQTYTAAAAKSLQSCPPVCDPMDSNTLGFSDHRILQARILEWVAISFSMTYITTCKINS